MTTEATGQTTTPTADGSRLSTRRLSRMWVQTFPRSTTHGTPSLRWSERVELNHEPTHLTQYSATTHGRTDGCWEFEIGERAPCPLFER